MIGNDRKYEFSAESRLRPVSFNYYAETRCRGEYMISLGLRNFFFVWAWLRSRLDSWECKSVEARQEDCEAKIIAWIGWFWGWLKRMEWIRWGWKALLHVGLRASRRTKHGAPLWYFDRTTLYVLWQCSLMQFWKEQLFFILTDENCESNEETEDSHAGHLRWTAATAGSTFSYPWFDVPCSTVECNIW